MQLPIPVNVGVLALQGGFLEHMLLLRRAAAHIVNSPSSPLAGDRQDLINLIEVRNPQDLAKCHGLIIPGGESTTIALIAAQSGLLEPLREFVKTAQKPTWGTCAGLILLSEEANAAKKGGQELIGGLDVRVHRNHFGRQIESFVADVELPFLAQSQALASSSSSSASGALSTVSGTLDSTAHFPGVFIRAPVVEKLLLAPAATDREGKVLGKAKKDVEILGVLPNRTGRVQGGPLQQHISELQGGEEVNDIVAVRQGNVLGTSFHPELTDDIRIHVWWLEQVLKTV
ncbi:class I glutamine amidotransferase-like protein [Coniella lustricola]|uniref:glutaminase n=1 Tax=Coniella lustricola TaxID=2025994 RepID=A0A2T3ANE6_9PEZI|nr:class I glutamine amidotransferase-like protein [Coniella lustricola]